ncbi:MAG: hypothetical protein ACXWB2_08205 [Acidimicrobiales bacterium]
MDRDTTSLDERESPGDPDIDGPNAVVRNGSWGEGRRCAASPWSFNKQLTTEPLEGPTSMTTSSDTTINLRAMQWTDLEHIADVRPIDDTDGPCLEEIREVLSKHGALDRFGVSLLHRHFDLAEDEMMLETTDLTRREHMVRPVTQSWIEEHGVTMQTTVVSFDEFGYHQNCGCNPRATGHHHL